MQKKSKIKSWDGLSAQASAMPAAADSRHVWIVNFKPWLKSAAAEWESAWLAVKPLAE